MIHDIIVLSVLKHIAQWLSANNLEDVTQVKDEYILRQMAKYNCFSLADVIDKAKTVACQLGLSEPQLGGELTDD